MNSRTVTGVHWSFWLIGVIALIWNVAGVANYLIQLNADGLASMPEAQSTFIEARPSWATAGFGVAVLSGVLGCILLLLKRSAAIYFLIASLLGVVVQSAPYLNTTTPSNVLPYLVTPFVISIFLVWYAKFVTKRGWTK